MIALLPILSLFAVASAQSTTSASATDVAVEEAKFEGMWSVHSSNIALY